MSGALLGLSAAGSLGTQALAASGATSLLPAPLAALLRSPRSLDTIIPDVTIEESHSDRLTVTQHPIADGTPISDHAYKMPATIVMRLGFTNANPIGAAVQGFQAGGGFSDLGGGLAGAGSGLLDSFTEMRVKKIYQKLQDLQFNRTAWDQGKRAVVPFKLTTGKRTYEKVVITELSIRTDRTTEYALMVECHMQEVWLVQTQSTTQPAQTDQALAPQTASAADQAQKNPAPAGPANSMIEAAVTGKATGTPAPPAQEGGAGP